MTQFSIQPFAGLLSVSLLAFGASAAHSQDYAASVTDSNLTSAAPYNNPNAVLGQPTTLINSLGSFGEVSGTYHASMVYPAYNVNPAGSLPSSSDLITSLGSAANSSTNFLTVKLAAPITHSDSHWYGDDFIVYGNAQFFGKNFDSVTPTTDMSQYIIGGDYGIYQNGTPTISVSADGIHFTLLQTSQTFFPENPYSWAGISAADSSGFGALNDFTKPVDPTLKVGDFVGQSVAFADNSLYRGSAGGQAFSLAGSGLSSIQYIQFTGVGNIDAVAGVSDAPAVNPVPEASSAISLGVLALLGAGVLAVRRGRKAAILTGGNQ